MPYEPSVVEPKWQKRWRAAQLYKTTFDPSKPKFYALDMFPYPSGSGLHVGHCEGYTATDIVTRWKRMQGFDVLHPMGWDAFGLPAEQYAIRTGVHPRITTEKAIAAFRRQIDAVGFAYDWDREVNTTDPGYVKWTQWIFLQLWKRGLAYEALAPINWCPVCKTGLANEEVSQGRCERGHLVERKNLRQWVLRITRYADRLLEDLAEVDWPESTLAMQRNWIGRSEGAEVGFPLAPPAAGEIKVFTTRPDTLFGATYMVLAPEHALVSSIVTPDRASEVSSYQAAARRKSDIERTDITKEKTGAFTGAFAVNPVNGKPVPVWIADYVLASYGTGAIMAVPGHDERDHEFARRFDLPIVCVVLPAAPSGGLVAGVAADVSVADRAFTNEGIAVNSPPAAEGAPAAAPFEINGLPTAEAKKKIIAELETKGQGKRAVTYKLRDWVFSRQRYWGEPIPIVHCPQHGAVPLPETALPLRLPEVERYEPTGTGESPLAGIAAFVETTCPACGQPARRETNTMPQWAGSCWYYLRYLDPKNPEAAFRPEVEKQWMPVDLYVGGAEHAVLHLLYARFWHKVLYDMGVVSTREPFRKLRHQGTVLAHSFLDAAGKYHEASEVEWRGDEALLRAGGEKLCVSVEKMAKSMLNGINPEDVIEQYGADVMRLYEMFMGDFELPKPWDTRAIEGMSRFLKRVWRLCEEFDAVKAPATDPHAVRRHKTAKAVTERLDRLQFNTAVSALMEYTNDLVADGATAADLVTLVKLLSPFAPHMGDEAWERLGGLRGVEATDFVIRAAWPTWDEALTRDPVVTLAVQVNGKLRGSIDVPRDAAEAEVRELAMALPNVQKHVEGKTVRKVIVVPGRIVNVVIG